MANSELPADPVDHDHDPAVTFHSRRRRGAPAEPTIGLSQALDSSQSQSARAFLQKLAEPRSASARYEFQGEIGRGGMGVILKVVDHDLHRPLAMKVVLGRGEDPRGSSTDDVPESQLRRFLEEAQITGQLDHPGIVPVHELGLDEMGRTYFTMRLVKGRDLKSLFERRAEKEETWSIARSLGVVLKICETMAYAHAKGVVHRDLKPANIMVGRFGETYVMDWGLAKIVQRGDPPPAEAEHDTEDRHVTAVRTELGSPKRSSDTGRMETLDGDVLGTPSYMSPEQARGEQHRVGARSDIYSLGAMVYHLLTKRAPYVDPDAPAGAREILVRVLNGEPTPIHSIAPEVPGELVSIVEKAMARDIDARYADMMEMADDIQAFLEGRVVRAHDTSALRAVAKLVKRNKTISLSILGFLLLGIASTAAFVWQQRQRVLEIEAEERKTATARDAALANEALARDQTYVANIIAADVSLRASETEEARRRLEQCPPELRAWEWEHLTLESDTSLGRIAHAGPVHCVALDPAGTILATAAEDGVLRLFDAHTRELRRELIGHEDRIHALSFSPDGRRLASASEDQSVRVWDVARGLAEHLLADAHEGAVTCIAFDAAGERFASGSDDERILVWNAATGEREAEIAGHEGALVDLAFLPDGRLASAADDGTVRLWQVGTTEPLFVRAQPSTAVRALAASDDGALLALGGADGAIHVWSLVEGEPDFIASGSTGAISDLAFVRGSRALLSASFDGSALLWDLAERRASATLRGHQDAVLSVAASADGARVVTGSRDGSARVWAPALGDNVRVLHGGVSHLTGMDVSRDGRRAVATSAYPGAVHLWDLASGVELMSRADFEDELPAVAIAPDASWVVVAREEDATLSVLDAATGAPRHARMEGHLASITSLDVSPDGATIASAAMDGRIVLWSARAGTRLGMVEDDTTSFSCVAFSPDGERVAAGSLDGLIRVWSVADLALLHTLTGHAGAVRALTFGPGEDRLTSGALDNTVRVWDLARGETLHTLPGHVGGVVGLGIDASARRIVSGSLDGTLRLWDAKSGQHLLTLRGHGLPLTAVHFAGDGERILSTAFDDTLRIWESVPVAERLRAHRAGELVARLHAELGESAGGDWKVEARRRLGSEREGSAELRAAALQILEDAAAR